MTFQKPEALLLKRHVVKCLKILDNGQGQKKEMVTASYTTYQSPIALSYDIFKFIFMFSGTVSSLEISELSIIIFSLRFLLVNPCQTPVLMLVSTLVFSKTTQP
jgi:hypothetical protein